MSTVYNLAGDMLASKYTRLGSVLETRDRQLSNRNGKLELRGEKFNISVCPSALRRREQDFLVAGILEGSLDQVRGLLKLIIDELKIHDVIYNFEVSDAGGHVFGLRDPRFCGNAPVVLTKTLRVIFNPSNAPDGERGRERIDISEDGNIYYHRWMGRRHSERNARTDPRNVQALFAALEQSSFSDVPAHQIPPGASLVVIQVEQAKQSKTAKLDLYFGMKLPGYGGLLERLLDWVDWLYDPEARPHADLVES